ncbi:molybdopterin-dependent oxidoreductase [Nitriliruptor alkaliphilus]|uniref:molybdopterin-dependent oxidoreductase n=1 Tax=Nitriliruptor alkaliphilus TaxID=427918 RepID=UPI001B8097EB|nr:molybdopterin-dependent oxidoreductase [Nitriliruptor alkaliphilus]
MTGPRGTRLAAPTAGLLAVAVALATAELVAGILPGGQSPLAVVADRIIVLMPAVVVGLALDLLGTANRPVLLLSMLGVSAAVGASIGRWAARWRWAAPLGFLPFVLLGTAAGIADPLLPTATAVTAPPVGALAGLMVLWRFPGTAAAGGGDPSEPGEEVALPDPTAPPGPTRRDVLVWAGPAAGAAVVFAVTGRTLQMRAAHGSLPDEFALPAPADPLPPPPATTSLDVEGISPLLTSNDDFFRIDTAFRVPRIDPDAHVVRITGLVDQPYSLSYDQLLEMADTEADVTLTCVSNEVGGGLIGNARWHGVPLERVLERAGVRAGATQVVGRAVDGWTAGFPLEVLDGRPALIAVGMNGESLPVEHGFPVRLVIAGLYGYVSDTKWLAEIELTTFDAYDAYWVRRGWAREGPIKTQSRIDVPRHGASLAAGPVAVAGVAWAGDRGIERVEVSVDDRAWEQAELADELAPTTWRQWRLRWDAEPGEHTLRVRATDGTGETQTDQVRPPAPDGATGHHTIRISVA